MEDGDVDGGLRFDFEGGLDSVAAVMESSEWNDVGNHRNFRKTVCRHCLRGLCMKGDACGFLHQYDKSRMPVCRFFRLQGECCAFKHTNTNTNTNEDNNECKMYKMGFCPNGPNCRYRHTRLPGPPPPVEEVLRRIQQLNHGYSNGYFQNGNVNIVTPQAETSSRIGQGPNVVVNQPTKTTMNETPRNI